MNQTLDDGEKIKMCKYLMYLFAGALAENVHVATKNVMHKWLNKKIKDMSNKEFCALLVKLADKNDTKTKLMNDTNAYKCELVYFMPNIASDPQTPSNAFNSGIERVAKMMNNFLNPQPTNLNEQPKSDKFITNFLGIFNETRAKINSVGGENLHRCPLKRPCINIKRGFKRLFGKQDFSYASNKYKNVFACFDLDKTKTGSIAK